MRCERSGVSVPLHPQHAVLVAVPQQNLRQVQCSSGKAVLSNQCLWLPLLPVRWDDKHQTRLRTVIKQSACHCTASFGVVYERSGTSVRLLKLILLFSFAVSFYITCKSYEHTSIIHNYISKFRNTNTLCSWTIFSYKLVDDTHTPAGRSVKESLVV